MEEDFTKKLTEDLTKRISEDLGTVFKQLGLLVDPPVDPPVDPQAALIDELRQKNQALQWQVDALKQRNATLEDQNNTLKKEVEEYASVKTALRTALGPEHQQQRRSPRGRQQTPRQQTPRQPSPRVCWKCSKTFPSRPSLLDHVYSNVCGHRRSPTPPPSPPRAKPTRTSLAFCVPASTSSSLSSPPHSPLLGSSPVPIERRTCQSCAFVAASRNALFTHLKEEGHSKYGHRSDQQNAGQSDYQSDQQNARQSDCESDQQTTRQSDYESDQQTTRQSDYESESGQSSEGSSEFHSPDYPDDDGPYEPTGG